MREVNCTCNCGKARLAVTGPLLGRFMCHCTVCQSVHRAPFADATVLMAKHVPYECVEHVRFEARQRYPAARRAYCLSCGCQLMAYMTVLPFFTLAFVPVARYPEEFHLPEPGMHVFYNSRVADVADELPRYNGNWPSRFAILRMVFRARVAGPGRIRAN